MSADVIASMCDSLLLSDHVRMCVCVCVCVRACVRVCVRARARKMAMVVVAERGIKKRKKKGKK